MENIRKLIGAIVGGILGIIALVINNKWGFDLSSYVDGLVEVIVSTLAPLVGAWIGVYVSPKNVSTEDKAKDEEIEALRQVTKGSG